MLTLPDAIVALLEPFAPLFDAKTWRKARILTIGMVLAPRKRTVTAALRMMGLGNDVNFARYHEVLSRARWSQLAVARVLLTMLIEHLGDGDTELVFAIDETLERRGGRRIKTPGMFRDAVRSFRSHTVISSGLRWVSLMWLSNVPFANRTWALPIITALAPPECYHRDQGRRHKTIVDWARQMICQLRHFLPDQPIVVVADGGYAVMDLYGFCQSMTRPVTMATRMRLDASLYEPAPPRRPGQVGRPRIKGARLPRLRDLADDPATRWTRVEASWYGGKTRGMEVASGTALCYRSGKAPVPIRWVLARDWQGRRDGLGASTPVDRDGRFSHLRRGPRTHDNPDAPVRAIPGIRRARRLTAL